MSIILIRLIEKLLKGMKVSWKLTPFFGSAPF